MAKTPIQMRRLYTKVEIISHVTAQSVDDSTVSSFVCLARSDELTVRHRLLPDTKLRC